MASDELDGYLARTPASRALYEAACRVLPGGDTRTTIHHPPYPLYLARGAGAEVWDADGNAYADFTNNHTALVHGNAYGPVLEAVRGQMADGTCFGTPHPMQVAAAEVLTDRIPALERVRFCASGTEATMHATRAVRAATGRPLIAKAEGAYHGSQDDVFVSTHPTEAEAGPADHPASVARCPGLGRSAVPDTVVIPFNDPDAAVARLEEVGDQLAAVLVEPVMGSAGMVAAEPAYLEALREVTGRVGALLVIDEVITLRLATGGAQEHFGIEPDLSCFGKMLGGGFPLGAFGGSAEVMAHFDPERPDALAQPGSMNAYPVALAASMATLRDLTPERIVALNEGGGRLRDGLREVAAHHGAPVAVTGLGSLLALHTTDRPVRNFRDTWSEDRDLGHRIFLGLLNEGVLIDRRGAACLSTATTDAHVARFVDALDAVLARNC